ncbi:hypothetical protein JCM6882_006917 [Rhodosporidiobolus microsporus]
MPLLPDDGFDALLNPSGPPSFEHRLQALTKAVGRHPVYKNEEWSSGSETEAQLSEYEGCPSAAKSAKRGRGEVGAESAAGREVKVGGLVKDAAVGGRTRSSARGEPEATTTSSAPPPPSTAAAASSNTAIQSSRARPSTQRDDAMDVDEPAAAPVAGPSKSAKPSSLPSSSRRQTRSSRSTAETGAVPMDVDPPARSARPSAPVTVKPEPSPSPVKPVLPPSSPILELSSDEAEDRASKVTSRPSKRTTRRDSTIRAASTAALLTAQKATRSRLSLVSSSAALPKPGRGTASKTAKKPRISLEQEIEKLQKLTSAKLGEEFKTVSDFIAHLNQFEPASTSGASKRILSGTRICFVNTDHWRSSATSHAVLPIASTSSPAATRNRFDQGLRTMMTIVAKHGAVLVPPEQFLPPPYDVPDDEPFDPVRAEREGWTTHVIPFVPSGGGGRRLPSYDQVLACLGPEPGGIRRDELGPFVKVVQFEWVSASVGAKGKALEFDWELKGDFRVAERKEREDPEKEEKRRELQRTREKMRERERREREKEEAMARRPGARGRPEDEDTDREDDGSDDDGGPPKVSPFGPDDWPLGEAPPSNYFDHAGSSHSGPSSLPPRKRARGGSFSPSREEEPPRGSTTPPPRSHRQQPKATTTPSSDPIVDADQTTIRATRPSVSPTASSKKSPKRKQTALADNDPHAFAIDELADQCAMIDEMGASMVDAMLKAEDDADEAAAKSGAAIDWDDELMILSSRPMEDNETDEENEEEEAARRGAKKGKKKFNPRARIPRDNKYACDDPSKGNRNGPNEEVAKVLDRLANLQEKNSFRERGYRNAAGRLRNFPEKITNHGNLVKLRGIGDKMAQKILEIQRTGTHRRFSHQTPKEAAAAAFGNVYGIGAALAEALYEQGARSIEDLRANQDKYGLHWDQRVGLMYYEDLLERIPRSEMDQLFEIVKAEAHAIDPKLELFCMGSYRRGEASSGDIDIMLTRPDDDGRSHSDAVKKLWERLEKMRFVRHTLTEPSEWDALDAVVHGLCILPEEGAKMRRIDILCVPWNQRAAALIYFTGNDYFNRSLRLKARHLGYRLNQRGLYKNVARDKHGQKITEGIRIEGLDTEEKLLNKLGVKWRPPEERKP